MTETRRNYLVAIFVAIGIALLSWLVFKFGDLPRLIYRVDTYTVSLFFDDAGGVQANSDVIFRGYPVGRVIGMRAPELLPRPGEGEGQTYLVRVDVAISDEHKIPANVVPRIQQRGFGSAYIKLALEEAPVETFLADGAKLAGSVAGGGVLPESLQQQLESLSSSLTRVADALSRQLEPVSPEEVDAEPNTVRPNLTTAIMRLDRTLKSADQVIGDSENQRNIREGLADFAALADEARGTLDRIEQLADEAGRFVEASGQTLANIESSASDAQQSLHATAAGVQEAADAFAGAMKELERLLQEVREGEGTTGRLVSDPRLYEELVDTLTVLQETLKDFQSQIALWREHGILYKE